MTTTDDDTTQPQQQPPEPDTPAAARNTEPDTQEHMIPKSRFDEVNKSLKKAEAELKRLLQAQDERQAKELEQQGQWQKLAEQEAAKRQNLEAQLEAQVRQLETEKRNRLATERASSLGAIDPTDANFIQAVADVDLTQPDAEAQIQQRLESLKEKRPYLFQGQRPPASLASFNPSQQPQQPQRETDAQRRDRLYGSGRSIWDADRARERGGGAVIVKSPTKAE